MASEHVRALYREWKGARLVEAVAHHASDAYGAGRFAAVAPGRGVRWAVGGDRPCPDCDDNRLAGPVPVGEAFPTGHCAPPAHAGCSCVLMPAGDD